METRIHNMKEGQRAPQKIDYRESSKLATSHVVMRQFWAPLLVPLLLLLLGAITVDGQNVNISVPIFNDTFFTCTGIPAVLGYDFCNFNASLGYLDLLSSQYHAIYPQQAARLIYKTPITFYSSDMKTFASFSAFFSFSIAHTPTHQSPDPLGSGIAFLIAPSVDTPTSSDGAGFGLLSYNRADGSSIQGVDSRVVAVEFDTYLDPSIDALTVPHVGLDINSLVSVTAAPLDAAQFLEKNVGLWIDYNASLKLLQVFIAPVTTTGADAAAFKPVSSVISWSNFQLSSYIQRRSFVGISAGTNPNAWENNHIFYWSFKSSGFPPTSALVLWFQQWWEPLSKKKKMAIIAGASVATIVSVYLCAECIFWLFYKKVKDPATPKEKLWPVRRRTSLPGTRPKSKDLPSSNKPRRTRDSLSVATPLDLWDAPTQPKDGAEHETAVELDEKDRSNEADEHLLPDQEVASESEISSEGTTVNETDADLKSELDTILENDSVEEKSQTSTTSDGPSPLVSTTNPNIAAPRPSEMPRVTISNLSTHGEVNQAPPLQTERQSSMEGKANPSQLQGPDVSTKRTSQAMQLPAGSRSSKSNLQMQPLVAPTLRNSQVMSPAPLTAQPTITTEEGTLPFQTVSQPGTATYSAPSTINGRQANVPGPQEASIPIRQPSVQFPVTGGASHGVPYGSQGNIRTSQRGGNPIPRDQGVISSNQLQPAGNTNAQFPEMRPLQGLQNARMSRGQNNSPLEFQQTMQGSSPVSRPSVTFASSDIVNTAPQTSQPDPSGHNELLMPQRARSSKSSIALDKSGAPALARSTLATSQSGVLQPQQSAPPDLPNRPSRLRTPMSQSSNISPTAASNAPQISEIGTLPPNTRYSQMADPLLAARGQENPLQNPLQGSPTMQIRPLPPNFDTPKETRPSQIRTSISHERHVQPQMSAAQSVNNLSTVPTTQAFLPRAQTRPSYKPTEPVPTQLLQKPSQTIQMQSRPSQMAKSASPEKLVTSSPIQGLSNMSPAQNQVPRNNLPNAQIRSSQAGIPSTLPPGAPNLNRSSQLAANATLVKFSQEQNQPSRQMQRLSQVPGNFSATSGPQNLNRALQPANKASPQMLSPPQNQPSQMQRIVPPNAQMQSSQMGNVNNRASQLAKDASPERFSQELNQYSQMQRTNPSQVPRQIPLSMLGTQNVSSASPVAKKGSSQRFSPPQNQPPQVQRVVPPNAQMQSSAFGNPPSSMSGTQDINISPQPAGTNFNGSQARQSTQVKQLRFSPDTQNQPGQIPIPRASQANRNLSPNLSLPSQPYQIASPSSARAVRTSPVINNASPPLGATGQTRQSVLNRKSPPNG